MCAGNFCEPGFPTDLLRGLLLDEALQMEPGELHDLMIEMAFNWTARDFIDWRERYGHGKPFNA
ncbi:MAG: hypothetical protein PHV34_11875 [Verrucomicrobiae bacterium]|nr:hypothetical protein [Verrucomicrobiae bacterium]